MVATVPDLDTAKRDTIAAQYLVACCGGASSVPRRLASRWRAADALLQLNVFLGEGAVDLHDKGKAALYFFADAEGIGTLVELDGRELWHLASTDRARENARQASTSRR